MTMALQYPQRRMVASPMASAETRLDPFTTPSAAPTRLELDFWN